MSNKREQTSKFLSLVLRHKPEDIGLTLDPQGWADIGQLIDLAAAQGTLLTRELIVDIVATSDKKRFALDPQGEKIRASQGHSVAVDLKLAPLEPPARLFHGTATRFTDSIRADGLLAGSRQHVHLSFAEETALTVGSRHGKPVLLVVRSSEMYRDGYEFFLSDNGVWLTSAVPAEYLDFPA